MKQKRTILSMMKTNAAASVATWLPLIVEALKGQDLKIKTENDKLYVQLKSNSQLAITPTSESAGTYEEQTKDTDGVGKVTSDGKYDSLKALLEIVTKALSGSLSSSKKQKPSSKTSLNSSTNSEDFSVSIYEGDIILHIYKSEGNWNIDTETDITSSFRAPRFKQYETESDILTWLKQRYDKVELLTEETPAGSKKDVLYLEGDQVVVKCSLTGSADSREWRCTLRDRTDSWTWSYDAELTPEKLLKQLSEDTEIELQLSSKENYDLKLKQLEKGLQASKRILRRGKPLNASRQSLNRAVKLNSAMSDSLVQVLPAEESFFVSCNEGTLVLKVYKENGKWHEQAILDEKGIFAPVRYMGYLTKADIKSWLIQDYRDVRTITEAEAAELAAAEPTDEEVVKDKFWFLGKTHAGKAALSDAYGSFEWLATVEGPDGCWEYYYPESSSKEEVLAALGVDCDDSFKEVSDYEANNAENAIIKARRKTNSSRHVSLKASRDVQKLNPAGPIKINASLDDGGLEKAFTSLSPEVQPVQGILITVPEEADGVIEPGVYMAFYDATEGCYVLSELCMSGETCIGYASIDELTNACFGYPTSTAPMSILDEEVLV